MIFWFRFNWNSNDCIWKFFAKKMFQQIFRSKSLNRIGLFRTSSVATSGSQQQANCIIKISNSIKPKNLIQLNQTATIVSFGKCLASKKNVFSSEENSARVLKDGDEEKVIDGDEKKPKYRGKTQDFKHKIYLKDESGRMLGLKTRDEANLIANKNNLILVEDLVTTKKIPTFKLQNPRTLSENDKKKTTENDESEESSSSSSDSDESSKVKSKPFRPNLKHFIFTSKLSDHDLITKVNQVKKWIRKGQETVIRVNANKDNRTKLELINAEFDRSFNHKNGCKINQRRLTDRELKFNIVPVDPKLIERFVVIDPEHHDEGDEGLEQVIDLDTVDPNKLLTMDEDQLLQKK